MYCDLVSPAWRLLASEVDGVVYLYESFEDRNMRCNSYRVQDCGSPRGRLVTAVLPSNRGATRVDSGSNQGLSLLWESITSTTLLICW
jgi:hypothetical protein